MGHIESADGALTINDDASDVAGDLQAIVDMAMKTGGLLKVNSAQRQNLTGSQTRVGWLIIETDTGLIYERTNTAPQGVLVGGASLPEINLVAGQVQSAAANETVRMWAAPGTSPSRSFSDQWFTYASSGDITVKKAGYYRISARVLVAAVAGQALALWLNSTLGVLSQDSVVTSATLGVMAKLDVASVYLPANAVVNVIIATTSGSVALGGPDPARSSGEFSVQFLSS
ncbi:hypothetical protein [Microbacterium enclense]|uniref:C1q domain-containing protein n=1 Tax=Microbacterium enclense TaxID=993073 RepID=A0A1G6NUJ6_9MICO|nr:hypothetical protein [Microbacterium enclense]KSU52902.1 hypothetical protein AS029_12910 [Microbacterium enclense]SDC71680.1 hypothetical protein SAMN05216418_2862 [Microbacterium enclense]